METIVLPYQMEGIPHIEQYLGTRKECTHTPCHQTLLETSSSRTYKYPNSSRQRNMPQDIAYIQYKNKVYRIQSTDHPHPKPLPKLKGKTCFNFVPGEPFQHFFFRHLNKLPYSHYNQHSCFCKFDLCPVHN